MAYTMFIFYQKNTTVVKLIVLLLEKDDIDTVIKLHTIWKL